MTDQQPQSTGDGGVKAVAKAMGVSVLPTSSTRKAWLGGLAAAFMSAVMLTITLASADFKVLWDSAWCVPGDLNMVCPDKSSWAAAKTIIEVMAEQWWKALGTGGFTQQVVYWFRNS